MSKDVTFTATITRVKELNSSRWGNPAWMVYFEDHAPMRTMSDTAWSNEADNPEWRKAKVVVTATRNGRIRYCTHVEPEGGVIIFEPGEVWLDPETGEFTRTTVGPNYIPQEDTEANVRVALGDHPCDSLPDGQAYEDCPIHGGWNEPGDLPGYPGED